MWAVGRKESLSSLCAFPEKDASAGVKTSLYRRLVVTKDLLGNNAFAEKSTVECPGHAGHHSSAFLTNVSSDVSS